jgi:hypothetical protein
MMMQGGTDYVQKYAKGLRIGAVAIFNAAFGHPEHTIITQKLFMDNTPVPHAIEQFISRLYKKEEDIPGNIMESNQVERGIFNLRYWQFSLTT